MDSHRALLIPDDPSEPVTEFSVPKDGALDTLQLAVGGHIEALNLPPHVDPDGGTTAYVNEEGKYIAKCKPNVRATKLFVPGVGLFKGDYIAGNLVLVGFDVRTGDHRDIPETVERQVRKIEREAAQ